MSRCLVIFDTQADMELAGPSTAEAAFQSLLAGDLSDTALGGFDQNDLVITFDEAAHPPGARAFHLRWAGEGRGQDDSDRLIAPVGRPWRCAPWPVADKVFSTPPVATAATALVIAADDQRRRAVARELLGRGYAVRDRAELTVEGLVEAHVVVVLADIVPVRVMAPLAARRILVLVAPEPDFGLEPGIDHLLAPTDAEAIELADAALATLEAYASVRAFGAITAAAHRASIVYPRLMADLTWERAAGY